MSVVESVGERARALHRNSLVFDALSLYYVVHGEYLERMEQGGVNATIITAQDGMGTFAGCCKAIDTILEEIRAHPDRMLQALSASDVRKAKAEGKIAIILGFQDARAIEEELAYLRTFHRLGLRVLQLTYTGANFLGDGCGERTNRGLTYWGMDVVAECNRLRILVDVSHCGEQVSLDACRLSKAPVVCTHANALALCPSGRNKSDEVLRAVADTGGVVGVTPLPRFVASQGRATLDQLVDHIDHMVKVMGVEHVGIGCDFTEYLREKGSINERARVWRIRRPDIFGTVDDFYNLPYAEGLEGIAKLPNLTEALCRRGYSDDAVEKILGANFLRVFEEVVG